MNVFKLRVGDWDGDQCVIYTNLREEHIRKVLEPMSNQHDEMRYFIEDYIHALEEAYPSKIILSELNYQTIIQL